MFQRFAERYPNPRCIARHVRFAHSGSETSLMAFMWYQEHTFESKLFTFNVLDRAGRGDAFASGLIRRWIPGRYGKEPIPFRSESIISHINISDDKYCQIPIAYDYNSRRIDWKAQDRECYNIWGYEQLPSADEVLKDPAAYAEKILLPYKNGMGWFIDSKIGTGISVIDFRYTNSFKMSKIDQPQQRFAEKDMIELYPLQLQSGDNAANWIFYTNALRHIPIQYNQSTVLPLPLHLAKSLEEYRFDA